MKPQHLVLALAFAPSLAYASFINTVPPFTVDTFSDTLIDSVDSATDPDNDIRAASLASGSVNSIRVQGNLTAVIPGTFSSEARLRLLDSGGGQIATVQPSTGNTFTGTIAIDRTVAVTPFDAANVASIEFFESFDDDPGADARWEDITVTFIGGGDVVVDESYDLGSLPDGVSTQAGQMVARGVDFVDFTLDADSDVVLETVVPGAGSQFDTEIGLYDSAGNLVANNDDIGGGVFLSRLSLSNLAAGDYTLVIGGFNTTFPALLSNPITRGTAAGNWELDITVSPPTPPTPPVDLGVLSPGSVDAFGDTAGNDLDFFTFTVGSDLTATGVFRAETLGISNQFDTELGLYDSAGQLVANDDDGGEGLLSRIQLSTLPAGDYTLVVGGWDTIFTPDIDDVTGGASFGDYRLRVTWFRQRSVTCNTLACDATNRLVPMVNQVAGTSVISPSALARLRPSAVAAHLNAMATAVEAAGCDITGYTGGVYDHAPAVQAFDARWEGYFADSGDAYGVCVRDPNGFIGDYDGDDTGAIGDDFAAFNQQQQLVGSRGDSSGYAGGAWIRTGGTRGVFVTLHGTCPGDAGTALDPWYIGSL